MDIVGALNEPQRDEVLLAEAGVSLDRALFPLLVGIGRFGPIGIVDLAGRAGRDYTTVSRQVAKLESLGLVLRQPRPDDRRVNEAVLSLAGKEMTGRLDAARERMADSVFGTWEPREIEELARLTRKFADALWEDSPRPQS